MALRRSKSEQAEDAIMRGVLEIEAFKHIRCTGKDPTDDDRSCSEAIIIIVITSIGENIACGGYCINHLFMLEPYVVLAKEKIGLEDTDASKV